MSTGPCTATADTTIGAHCEITTTMDAITPGAVPEGARSIWEFGRARVYDGGPDRPRGDAGQHPVRGPGSVRAVAALAAQA
jgi:hypothetical protein